MSKKILIISSDNTGHGHKSITESLCEKIGLGDDVKIHVVDGFSLGGQLLQNIGKSYGPITRNTEQLWKMVWSLSSMTPSLINGLIESQIRDNFLTLLDEVRPDLILSVHPNFNGSVLNILDKQHLKIPFIILIADLVNIYPLWADKRADYIISPTVEARDKCIEYGIPDENIKVLGFPVRSRFFRKGIHKKVRDKDGAPLKCLIMSGGEGVGNMKKIAENLLDHFDCTVKIVAGRNEKLKAKLEHSLKGQYGDKVEIYGFTKNIQDLMFASDIAFTRGSPNVMFEAIASNTPLIITGALPGQEEDNPAFAERSNLGVICKNPSDIKQTITALLENDGEKLNNIIKSQRKFINAHAAEDILEFILNVDGHYFEAETELSFYQEYL
ncbi:UDP-N-acetylglucosamine--LPS N-acetylglucosamine transferase [Bacillus canaveralius]|uniref:UDP-N-acetylglucosamine--LPS N-acetylglucosamine transferase n=1 Tax=Bacillus canaveralius TaxID=1403243 RepID=A0A2N5GQR5_9BACI|nr:MULTISPECIES: glycosyltransferase [Bacillus]PLR85584.1 UDP-N-acetylglucosamine--LPS N-acetylglucosamine transferase [Bacillus canaveralius]PLR86422.1 UDP-N-acetylglucosamine--LPS N-acetylglucosamine transferase [Bacillus sp. V33-4]PLR94755.1 UDP-N-acetylglucosamine--LPS N-acetylglucosamine transferase [Bacillus canaveralius]